MTNSLAYGINQRQFEHQRVKLLVRAFEFPIKERKRRVGELMEYARNNSFDGEGWLSFADVESPKGLSVLGLTDCCPVKLASRSYSSQMMHAIDLPRIFQFQKTRLYAEYLSQWQCYPDDSKRPFGLIFGLGGIRAGVILHDAELPGETGRTTLHYFSRVPDEPAKLTLEPYDTFLQRMVRVWRMGVEIARTHRQCVYPQLEKWMVTRFGSGPAVIVLAWLWGAWLDSEKRYFGMRDGRACLILTQSIIAKRTGLSDDSVKEGIKRLREEGAIKTTRGDRRTCITVVDPEDLE